MLVGDLATSLPRSVELVPVDGDTVPKFDVEIPRSEEQPPVTIAPPVSSDGRGGYVSNVCAPMASKKSFHARVHAWSKRSISVVIAVRVSYALNALQEWRESVPTDGDGDAAAREALADFEELSIADRCATEDFGPGASARSSIWCYLVHGKRQLEELFRAGQGVCIVSPRASIGFLRAIRDMGPHVRIDNLYVEEVKALSQMLFTKVLPDATAIDALSALAMERSRCVFSFCADWLFDPASANLMQYIVRDRPHLVFNIREARPHMHQDVAFFYEKGLDDAEEAVRGAPAFNSLYDKMLACCLLHRDFDIWAHVNYEKEAIRMYTRAIQLGIPSLLITGDCDDDDKERHLTDLDKESVGKQIVFSTATVTVGVNLKRNFSACIVLEGIGASGPIEAAQSAGRRARSKVPECNFIAWFIKGAGPPKEEEALTPLAMARRAIETSRLEKMRFAQRSNFASEVVHPLLLEVKAVNKAYEMDKRSHCALAAHTLVDYKPGWKRVDSSALALPLRLAALQDAIVCATLEAAQPLPIDQIQKIDSLSDDQKMMLGYQQLIKMATEKFEAGGIESYPTAEKDVLDTCGGMFAHAHLSDTFVRDVKLSGLDKQTVRAWKAARHFSKIAAFTPKQLLVVQEYEDRLNLAACHLGLGSRRVHLARSLLKAAAADGAKVGLYTRLPERIDALEQASVLIGVPCLAIQRQVLPEGSPFLGLLQLDKMGVADVIVSKTLKRLSVLIDAIAKEDAGGGSTKTLWSAFTSLLALICVEAVVVKDRKMTVEEQKDWMARNECTSGFLASKLVDTTVNDEGDAMLDEMCGTSELSTSTASTCDPVDALPPPKRAKKDKAQGQTAREGANLRVPVEIELRRRVFYFDADSNLLDARKARCVKDGVYKPANQKPGTASQELAVTGVDFVADWRVFSAELGESITTRKLLARQMPLATVEHEISALIPRSMEPAFHLTDEQRAVFTTAAAGQGIKRALHVNELDGCIYMNEPIPAGPFERELKRLRAQKKRFGNRMCSPKLLDEYRKASKADKKRLDREHEEKTQDWMGPKHTSQLFWLEAVNEKATEAAGGIRWLPVVYRKKMGMGRETASYPSLQCAEGELRRKLMKGVAHDWDIVSCHCFLVEAVVRGFLGIDPQVFIPTLYEYNCTRAADVLSGRKSSENEFLRSIADWYGVTMGEAKFGPIVLLNQGSTATWLKGLDPPRDMPADQGDHPKLTSLQAEALTVRKLFFRHAATLFPGDAFEGLRQRLRSECVGDSLASTEKMEKKLFSYCLMHFESIALKLCTDASAKHGLPPLTFVYDGFLQLHVEGGAGKAEAVKREAEAAMLAYFKSPVYLIEKPFYNPGDGDEDDGIDERLIVAPRLEVAS